MSNPLGKGGFGTPGDMRASKGGKSVPPHKRAFSDRALASRAAGIAGRLRRVPRHLEADYEKFLQTLQKAEV